MCVHDPPYHSLGQSLQIRERDTYARTFPPVPATSAAVPQAQSAAPRAIDAGAASSRPAQLLGLDDVLLASDAQVAALFGDAGILPAAASACVASAMVEAKVVRPPAFKGEVGQGFAIAPPPPAVAASLDDDLHDASAPLPPPAPLDATILSMLGVGTADGGVDHAYLYGCVLEASRATEAALRTELRSQRVGAGAAAGGAATAAGDDEVDEVMVDDDGEEEGPGRAAAAAGGVGQSPPQQSSGASANSAPLRRLHSVLRTMINVEFLRADEDTLQVRGAPRDPGGCSAAVYVVRPPMLGCCKQDKERVQSLQALYQRAQAWRGGAAARTPDEHSAPEHR